MPIDRTTLLLLVMMLLIGILQGLRARQKAAEGGRGAPDEAPARPPRPPRDAGDAWLPEERYDVLKDDDLAWMDPQPSPLDRAYAAAVRRFAAAGAEERARMRGAVDDAGMNGLRVFALHAALFALRERSEQHLRDGLAAVASMDAGDTDPRDISFILARLNYSALRIGADPAALFRQAGALADGEIRERLTGYPARPPEEKDLRTVDLLEEVQLPGGAVFLQRGIDAYHPTRDLVPLMLELARVLAADQYRTAPPSIATSLPVPWVIEDDSPEPRRALRDVRAGASMLSFLHPDVVPVPEGLQLFVVEAADERDARLLLDASRRPHPHPQVVLLGVAEGPYFALLVGGSHVRDVESYETPERMARFAAPVAALLRRHAASS